MDYQLYTQFTASVLISQLGFDTVYEAWVIQNKEIMYKTTSITTISGGFEITINTNDPNYRVGDYTVRWFSDYTLTTYYETTFSIYDSLYYPPVVVQPNNNFHYLIDITWNVQANGDFIHIYDKDVIASEINAIIKTILGSLANEPTFGTLVNMALLNNDPYINIQIQEEINSQLTKQMPEIKVNSVTASFTSPNIIGINIKYYIIPETSQQNLVSVDTSLPLTGTLAGV